MQYTTFISNILKNHGSLNLSPDAQRKVNNIIWLEGAIQELNKLKPLVAKAGMPSFLDMRIFERHRQLTEITHNLEPMELLEKLSKNLPY